MLYIPNVFSPNGDGINDILIFHLNPELAIQGSIRVFDRWGHQVFQSSDMNQFIWNGQGDRGQPLEAGVYTWIFVSSDESVVQRGDVTIIR